MGDEPAPGAQPAEGTPTPPPKSHRLQKALGVAATLVRNRDLLMQALELLRKAQAVTPTQEAELVAAYEAGAHGARERIEEIVERLQLAHLGRVAVSLKDDPEALRAEGRILAEAARGQARLLAEDARVELQRFLKENQPTIDAVERAGVELAAAGRELARSFKGAGKEAAEHLIYRGREVIRGADVAEYEQAAFDWVARSAPRVEHGLVRTLTLSGLVLLIIAGLVAGRNLPWVQSITFALVTFLLVALGLYLLATAYRLHRSAAQKREKLERLAAMTPAERREFFKTRWAQRRAASLAAPDASMPRGDGPGDRTPSGRLRET